MSPWKRWAAPVGGLLLSVLLSGCFVQPTDSLYALPRQSDAYYDLQNAIDAALPADAAYSGPLSGPNQQAVQLADLDGDGEDEALVFAKTSGEKPLKIYIFDAEDDSFVQTAVIEGDGTAFDAVEYVPVDDTSGMEIILGRQLSDQILQSLSVYSYSDGTAAELMHAAYTEYKVVDLNLDDRRDVLIFRQDTETRQGMAEYYTWEDGVMERRQTAALSKDIHTIERIVTGYVTADIPGVFVTSTYGEDALVTDVFAFRGQTFSNLTLSAESGVSTQLVRSYQVFATDIDEDGVVELPTLVALPSATAGERRNEKGDDLLLYAGRLVSDGTGILDRSAHGQPHHGGQPVSALYLLPVDRPGPDAPGDSVHIRSHRRGPADRERALQDPDRGVGSGHVPPHQDRLELR